MDSSHIKESKNINVLTKFFADCDKKKYFADARKMEIKHNLGSGSSSNSSSSSSSTNTDYNNFEDFSSDRLSPLLLVITKFLLKDAIDEIITVNNGKNNLPSTKIRLKRFKDRLIKYKTLYDSETIEPIDEALRNMIPMKLDEDIDYVRYILQETLDELETSRTFNSLKDAVEFDTKDQQDEVEIVEDFCKNKITLSYLEKKLKNVTEESNDKIKELNETIQELDNEIHFVLIENEIKRRLVENWETTRKEQMATLLKKEEDKLRDSYKDILYTNDREKRLAYDIDRFLNLRINENNDLTLHWMEKYEEEIESYDTQIQITKEKILDAQQKNKENMELYESRQAQIQSCLDAKEKQAKEKALQVLQLKSAIVLQAWWRGTMVRHSFGPYKKKKKGGKKGKKKK